MVWVAGGEMGSAALQLMVMCDGHLKKGGLFNGGCLSSADRLNLETMHHLYWARNCERQGSCTVGWNVMVTGWTET